MRRMVTDQEIAALGGTKLYKHTVTIEEDWGGGDSNVATLEFISLSNESFVGLLPYEISDKFINGWYIYSDEGDYRYPVLYIDLANNIIEYYATNKSSCTPLTQDGFLTDTVVAL